MKIFKWTGMTFLALLCSLMLIGLLAFTPWGSHVLLNGADAWLDELSLDYKSGGLGSELQLNQVKWQQNAINIHIENVQLDLDWGCLWSLSVCIEHLKSGNIQVNIVPIANEKSTAEPLDKLTLPFYLRVKRLELGVLDFTVQDQLNLSWRGLSASLNFEQELEVETLNINALQFDILSNDAAGASKPTEWTAFEYQPITQFAIDLPLVFDLADLNISPFTLSTNGQTRLQLSSVQLSAKADDKTLSVRQFIVRHKLGEVSATADIGLEGNLQHELNLGAKYKEPQGGVVNLSVSSVGDLQQLNADVTASGLVNASIALQAELAKDKLPLDLTISWQNLTWPLRHQTQLAEQFQSTQGQISLVGDLDRLSLQGNGKIAGQGIPSTSFTLQGKADREQLVLDLLKLNTLGGDIVAKGKVAFANSLEITSRIDMQHINPGVMLPDYQADINGGMQARVFNSAGQWQAELSELDINGLWRNYPLNITGSAKLDDSAAVVLNKLSIRNGENSIQLNGQLDSERKLDVDVMVNAANIGQSIAEMQGSFSLDAKLSGSLEQPSLQYSLQGQELAFADINVKAFDGKGQIIWNDIKPVSLELNVQNIIGVNNQIDQARLSLSGNAAAHELLLDTTSNKTNLLAKIQGSLQSTSWQGRWLEGQIESTYASLQLAEPFTISADWQEQAYSISPHCWQQEKSDLCIKQASFVGQQAKWDIALHDLNLIPLLQRVVPTFPPIDSTSQLSLSIKGQWLLSELPEAQLHAKLSPATWRYTDKKGLELVIEEFDLDAQISQQNVNAQVTLSGPEIGLVALGLQGEAGTHADQLDRPITGELNLSRINLAPLRVFIPELDKLEGKLAGDAQISGTLKQPLVNGSIVLSNGAVQGQNIPLIVSDVNQTLELQGDKASLSGTYLLGKGKGTINGKLAWRPDVSGQINIAGQNLELDYQSMLRAQVSPNIDVQFSPDTVKVRGEVIVPYARFKLRDLPQGTVSPSKDVVLVEQEKALSQEQQIIDLRVLVSVDPKQSNEVKLDAFGLTTDLRGTMQLESSKLGMVANGDVQLINGRYRAYGQNLLIREGDIAFNGPLDSPYLNIEAVRDPKLTADDVVAGIRVSGVAENPKVEVFSEPSMEQQQSLSYMLTGRGLGQSSGDSQDIILTNMLLGFGLGQSENMVTNIGQKLGFKDVALDTSGQGDGTQLSVSGYVAPGVQLRYGIGVFDSVSEVAIRYELLPQLYIEAVNGVGTAIDIYYSFSIEGSQNEKVKEQKELKAQQ